MRKCKCAEIFPWARVELNIFKLHIKLFMQHFTRHCHIAQNPESGIWQIFWCWDEDQNNTRRMNQFVSILLHYDILYKFLVISKKISLYSWYNHISPSVIFHFKLGSFETLDWPLNDLKPEFRLWRSSNGKFFTLRHMQANTHSLSHAHTQTREEREADERENWKEKSINKKKNKQDVMNTQSENDHCQKWNIFLVFNYLIS